MSTKTSTRLKRHVELSALEPRMLFDGAGLVSWEAGTAPAPSAAAEAPPEVEAAAHADAPAHTAAAPQIVFISPEVANPQQIRQAFGASAEIVLLSADRDGIDQISEALAVRSGIAAIHLVSHGSADAISLPGKSLSSAAIEARAAQIAGWAGALTADADILVYGCDVAGTEGGVTLVGRLAQLTGADVAASTNDTGGTPGADWTLEYSSGAIGARTLYSAGLGDPANYTDRLATVNLSGMTGWTTIMLGTGKDPYGDSQAGAADTDIIGDATHGSLYTAYDDNGTATVADDTLVFRMRIDNPTSTTNFGGVAIVGMDANLDGKVDLFFSVDGRNNGQAIRLLDPGTGANLSPSTTSTTALPTGWLANNGVYAFSASNYSVTAVSATTDPNWGPSTLGGTNNNLTGAGGVDAFISWRLPIVDIATVLAKPSPTDRNGVGPRGTAGIAGYNKDTVVQYISFTQTQTGPINGDLNGVGPNYDRNATFASLGTFTSPMSASNPVSDGLSILINEPIGDGKLAGAPGASEASSVTLSGNTKATVGSTVNLTITDAAAGSTTATATVTAGNNGLNLWSVSNVNLSALAEGNLTVSAAVTNSGSTVTDTATVLLDKTAPTVAINQLATTTAGTPTLSGSSNLPDGAVVTLTLDPDNNAATANLLYQAIVSGGAWTVNTATATPASGAMPGGGLSATTKITATAADAAGNTATAVALNRPTVTAQATGSTTPTIAGSWTRVAGDALTVKLYTNNAGVPGSLLATYTLAPAGDAWSVDLASAIKDGGGTVGALAADQTYHVVAEASRGGSTVGDTTSGELVIVGGPTITITDGFGANDGNVTVTVPKPAFAGTSSVLSGYITLAIDPAGNGTADLITYSVATDNAGNWTLDTSSAQPISGFMPSTGLASTAVVTASTAANANGQIASATQNLTVVIPAITIGTSAADASGVETTIGAGNATANIIVGDKLFNILEDDSVIVSGTTANLAQGTVVTITISDGVTTLTKTTTVAANGSFTLLSSGAGTANDGNAFNLSSLKNTGLTVRATASTVTAEKAITHDAIAPQIVLTTPSVIKTSAAAATGNTSLPQGSTINLTTTYPQTGLTATVDANGDFSTPLNMSGNGSVTITASSTATDLAGNKVLSVNQTVDYQNPNVTPPAVSITAISGTGGTDTTITSGDIGSGTTISGTFANTKTTSSGTLALSITDGFITKTSPADFTVTRNNTNGTWSAVLSKTFMEGFSNGTLVVTASLTDTVGTGAGTLFTVRDAAQPTLFLLSGTPSISITSPIDPNGTVNAAEDDALVIKGRAVNAAGGLVTVTVSDGNNATVDPSATTTVNDDGSWTLGALDLSALDNATLTVSATVDPDNNAATSNNASTSATVIHDKTPPVINITSAATVGNSNPVITGSATGIDVGASVTVTVDSDRNGVADATYTTTLLSDGTWRVASAIPTPVNSIIKASATDFAGNSATVTGTAIATLSPDTGSNAADFITSTRALTFTGIAGAGETVTVRLNGVQIGAPVLADVNGVWTLNHTGTQLASGSYTLTATTTTGGNSAVSTQTIVVDAQAVAISGISVDEGSSNTDYKTNDTTLVFNGTATTGAQVTLTLTDSANAEVFRQVATATGGAWTLDRTADALADGVYTLRAAVTDASGVTTTVSQAVTVDTRAQIGITTNYKSASTTPVLSGTTDIEAGRAISVTVGVGGNTYTYATTVASSGTWSIDTSSAIPSGSGAPITYANGSALTITASGTDVAGNSASTSKAMLIDVAAPVVNITTQLDYTGSNTPNGVLVASEDTSVILRGTTSNIANGGVVALTITDGTITIADTATVSNNAWQLSAMNLRGLANGTITVMATYYDEGGTAYSAVATVLHDKSATGTNVTIDSISTDSNVPSDFETNDNTLVFRGSAAPGATVAVTLTNAGNANVFVVNATADSGGDWSYDYSGSILADGSYTLKAQVGAGILVSRAVIVDTTAPVGAVTVTNPVLTSSSTPQLTGTAQVGAGETLTVSVNGKTYTNGDGKLSLSGTAWTLNIPASDALTPASAGAGFNGVYEVLAKITDAAGNTRIDASSNELTVQDLVAPAIDLDPSSGASINHSATSTSGAAVSLDDNADAMTLVDAGDRLTRLTITAAGLAAGDGANEKLIFGGTEIAADGSNAANLNLSDVTVGGVRVNIAYASGVFTLQRYNFSVLTAAEAQAVLRDIQYRNDAGVASTAGIRTFTFSARDDAGNVAASAVAAITVTGAANGPSQTVAITAITDDVAPVTGTVASGGISNDTAPGLSGTISAVLGTNEVLAVYRDGVKLGNASVTGTAWTYADAGLSDGASYSYTAKVENTVTAASGTASGAYTLAIDTSAPAQTVSIVSMTKDTGTAGDFNTSDGSAGRTVTGTLSAVLGAGEALELSFDGGVNWVSASVTGTGWTATDNVTHNGNWTIASRITDAAGNAGGAASQAVTLTGSPTQTVAITTITDDVAPVSGMVASGGISNDIAPGLSGTISAVLGTNEVLAVYRDGVKLGNASVTGTAWTYADAGLADGTTYSYTAQVENTVTASNGTASGAYTLTIDTSAPAQTVSIVSMTKDTGTAGDFNTSDGSAGRTVTGTLSAALGTGEALELSFDGGANWVSANVTGTGWTATDNVTHNGNWTITSRITDTAGNAGGAASQAVTLTGSPTQTVAITAITDDVAPVTGTVATGGISNDIAPDLSGTISAVLGTNEALAVYRDGVKLGNASVTGTTWTYADAGLSDGASYSYTAQVENTVTASNGTASGAYTLTIDTSAPAQTVSIVSMTKDTGTAGDFNTSDGSAGRTVTGTLSAALGTGESLELSFDGGANWVSASVTGTGWTATDSVTHNGNWTITSRITDAAGNAGGAASQAVTLTGSPTQTVAITAITDDVAPVTGTVASGGISNDIAPGLSGTISSALGTNEALAVYRDGVKLGNASVTGTAWTYADTGLADGTTYSYTAQVENTVTASNGTASGAYTLTIDTSAPAQTVSIVSMTKDTGTAGDFITTDGSAGRTVTGTLSAVLGTGEALEVSFDGGVNWVSASVTGTAWTATDSVSHNGNWTITSRITDAAGNAGGAASQAVTLTGSPTQTVAITAITDDVAPVTGTVASGGISNDIAPALSGTISSALGTNEVLAIYRDGVKLGNASVTGTAWTYADAGLADGTTYSYTAQVENTVSASNGTASGAYTLTIDTSAPAQTVSIVSMTKDTGTAGDFITADGSAGRTVAGTLSGPLGSGETLEVTVDGGVTWLGASVTGSAWTVADGTAHTGNWTIATRIVDAAGNAGGAATRNVILQGSPLQTVSITTVTDDAPALTGIVANGAATNDSTPAIACAVSAELGANEQLAVYRNGVRIGTATVTDTAWTFVDSGLADGATYSYTALVENSVTGASGTASAAYVIGIDTTAPQQTVTVVAMTKDTGTAGDFVTADGSAGRDVNGTLSAPLATGEVLELSFDGGATWVGASVTGTTWTATDNIAHTGNWTISTRILDAAGNAGGAGATPVTLNAAPQQTVAITAASDDVAPVTGTISNGGVTNDSAPDVSGSISAVLGANEVLAVYRNGVKLGNASVTGTSWAFADAGLADGATYSYTAQVENAATGANGAAFGAYILTIDTSAPVRTVSIVAMTKDTGTPGDFVTADGSAGRSVNGTLSGLLGNGETLELSFDGGATWVAASVSGSTWSATDGGTHGGNWTIATRIVDAAGNQGGLATRAVTLTASAVQSVAITAIADDVAPVAGTMASGGVSNDSAPQISGTLSAPLGANERVALFRNGVRVGVASVSGASWSFADNGLADGATYSYTAQVENAVSGEAAVTSAAYTLRIDTSAPVQTVTVVSMTKDTDTDGDFATSDGSANRTVNGTLSGSLGEGEVLEVSSDGGLTWVPASVNGGTWSATDSGAHTGNWTIATRIVDAAGNTGGATSRPVTLTAAPIVFTPDTIPAPAPAAPVVATIPAAVAAPVIPPADAPAVSPFAASAAPNPAEPAPAESSVLAPTPPLVSNGVPPPVAPATAGPVLFAQAAASNSVFEIETGSTATGSTVAVQSLTGTDIGKGFAINVRQADGSIASKDSFKLVTAVIKIEAGLIPEQDLLALSVASPNITAVYDAATGTLTLSGIATAAEYEQVIQGVKLRDADGGDVKSKRTLRFTIKSEAGQTQSGTKEYRGPESVPAAAPEGAPAPAEKPPGSAELPIKPGKPGLMAQIAKAHAQQTQGREQLAALASRQAVRPAAPDQT